MALPLLTASETRAQDAATIEKIGISGPVLMESAGRAVVEEALQLLQDKGKAIVFCGRGNNGGDGLVVARYLIQKNIPCRVVVLGSFDALSADASLQAKILQRLEVPLEFVDDEVRLEHIDLSGYDLVVDGILGTGLARAVCGLPARAIEKINCAGCPVLAIDLPSGINSDTGAVMGVAVRAKVTVTFGYFKPGLLLYPGAEYAGKLVLADIGLPRRLLDESRCRCFLWTERDMASFIGKRKADAHKGHFGHVAVWAGSVEKPGAAGLVCRAAVKSGAGLVTLLGTEEVLSRVVCGPVEYMGKLMEKPEELIAFCRDKSVLALGPGLGQGEQQKTFLEKILEDLQIPLVIDADGLNNLTGRLEMLSASAAPKVITPHPGEAARLLGCSTADIQIDRIAAARKLAECTSSISVLKGARTVVARPDGKCFIVPTGNPGMASGGSGDVLTGIIAALIAQGLEPFIAAVCGAYLHGRAGDLAALAVGQHYLSANDIIDFLAPALRDLENWSGSSSAEDQCLKLKPVW